MVVKKVTTPSNLIPKFLTVPCLGMYVVGCFSHKDLHESEEVGPKSRISLLHFE